LKGGHVIDPKNKIDEQMDVAISNGKNIPGCKKYFASPGKKNY
jgi:formylmethanofuran dehydrogenase subunit A